MNARRPANDGPELVEVLREDLEAAAAALEQERQWHRAACRYRDDLERELARRESEIRTLVEIADRLRRERDEALEQLARLGKGEA
jgi:hypothetical protein